MEDKSPFLPPNPVPAWQSSISDISVTKSKSAQNPSKTPKPLRPMARFTSSKRSTKTKTPVMNLAPKSSLDPFLPLTTPVEPTPVSMGISADMNPDFYKMSYPSFSSSEKQSSNDSPPEYKPKPVDDRPELSFPNPYIDPCTNYRQFSEWLATFFPKVLTPECSYLITLVLKIKSSDDIIKFLSYSPEDWRSVIGDYNFRKFLPNIVDLIII